MNYIAADGSEITDAMIDDWCKAYEQGEFPEGEHTVGKVIMGRPPISSDKTATVTIKIPLGMKVALNKKAQEQGVTMSAYARGVLASDLLATR